MKIYLSTILLLFISYLICAQQSYDTSKFRVTLSDLEMTTYEKDSTANALVLYDYGSSYVDVNDYDLITIEKHKIKILNKDGFEHATVVIYLQNNERHYEDVKNIIAVTYNLEDGRVISTKLDEKDIYKEKYNDNFTLVKFTLPNIKEGSVITYSFTRDSPFMFNYKGWNFQSEIPKSYSEYRASIPANWEYNIKLVGGQKLSVNQSEVEKNCLSGGNGGSSNCFNSQYVMEYIPAFIEEDYMTSELNYRARIEYELKTFTGFDGLINDYTKTWKTVDKDLKTDGDIGKQLNKSIKPEDYLSIDIINLKDKLKKAKAIYNYVQETYTWDGNYKLFSEGSVKDILKEKSGNVSSINILLHNLLKASNIDVKPVLLSTRENGFATKIYPVLSDFNYLMVQAKINDETYLLDATDNYLNFGEIPFRCLNGYGRKLDFKKGSEWIDIKPQKPSSVQYQVNLTLNENDIITGEIYSKRTGYHALNTKKAYYPNPDSYVTKLEDRNPNFVISNFDVTTEGIKSEDFREHYKIEYRSDDTGNNIYLNPFFVKFFTENPFKLQERTYPIDFGYKDSYLYLLTLIFSDNYTILEKPENANIALPNNAGLIQFSSEILENKLNILLKISFESHVYPPEYYPYLKEFMSKIVNIQTNSLVLIKKHE